MTHYAIAKKIVQKFVDAGHIAYFAGGWVRDYLMQHPSDDIDIATSASPEQVIALFSKTIHVGIQFGIVIVVEEGHQFEVATFREEEGYQDGRKPNVVRPTTPEQDAQRRDFTVNGMFFNPLTEEVIDYVGGRADLDERVIRAIGDPHERFREDRLRMIRAIRYASRFNFSIDPDTIEGILTHAVELFPAVSIERVWQEFVKMAKFPHFNEALINLHRFRLLPVIFPQLQDLPLEVIEERVSLLPRLPRTTPVILQLLELFPFHDRPPLADYLRLSNENRQLIEQRTKLEHPPELTLTEWVHVYAHPQTKTVLAFLEHKNPHLHALHHKRYERLAAHIDRLLSKQPLLTAQHLIKRGIPPGPEMGRLLREAERLSIEENIEDVATILDRLFSKNE